MKTILSFLLKCMMWLFKTTTAGLKFLWKKYPEVFSIPVALAVWVLSITVLRWLDPTSAVFDAGVFQIPIFSVIQLFVYASISWLVLGSLS